MVQQEGEVSCSWPKWRRLEADLWIDGEPELSTCTARQRRCHERKAPHGGEHCELAIEDGGSGPFSKWTLECTVTSCNMSSNEVYLSRCSQHGTAAQIRKMANTIVRFSFCMHGQRSMQGEKEMTACSLFLSPGQQSRPGQQVR
jgi:hypothetical protein